MSALEKAIEVAGGLTALADRLKTKPQVVLHWRKRGIPAGRVLAIESATGVPRHELAPKLYPDDPA